MMKAMNTASRVRSKLALGVILAIGPSALAQAKKDAFGSFSPLPVDKEAEQTARILGLDLQIQKLRTWQAQRPAGSPATLEELSIRQELLESIQVASLDVDGVLAELSNERNQLGDLRTSLQNRRDRTISRLHAAAFLAGSGAGAVVSATQFTTLSSTTQNVGDGIGIGSGVASTLFSLMAVRRQHGPHGSVGETPNMLAPLFGGVPVLNTHYPPAVLRYLRSVPPAADAQSGTRWEQLKAAWVRAGRLNASDDAKQQRKIQAVSTSENPQIKISIDDLTDRIAMLGDVMGRVFLMKRDLAVLMRSYASKPKEN